MRYSSDEESKTFNTSKDRNSREEKSSVDERNNVHTHTHAHVHVHENGSKYFKAVLKSGACLVSYCLLLVKYFIVCNVHVMNFFSFCVG